MYRAVPRRPGATLAACSPPPSATRSIAALTRRRRRSSWSGSPSPTPHAAIRLDAVPGPAGGRGCRGGREPLAGAGLRHRPDALDVLARLDDAAPRSRGRPSAGGDPASELAPGQTTRTAAHRGPRPPGTRHHRRGRAIGCLRLAGRPVAAGVAEPPPAGRRRSGRWRSLAWASSAAGSSTTRATSTCCWSRPTPTDADPRPFLDLARSAWRIDLDLRPEGRAGPLARTLASYLAYWDRWAETWEFQALLKARAGRRGHGARIRLRRGGGGPGVGPAVRRRPAAPGPSAQGSGRAGRQPSGAGRPGVEAGQGRHPRHRVRRTAPAAGPRARRSAAAVTIDLARAARPGRAVATSAPKTPPTSRPPTEFLRTVEHRLQLYEGSTGAHPAERARAPGPGWPACSAIETRPAGTAARPVRSRLGSAIRAGSVGSTSGCSSGRCWSRSRPAGGPAAVAGSGRRTTPGLRLRGRGPDLPGRARADPGLLAVLPAHEPHAAAAP